MALDKGQIALLKKLVRDDGWDVLMLALAQHIDKLNSEPITGNTEFETLRALHTKQGQVDGLTEFFSDIEKMNFND
jgi:hypothetical protein